MTDIFSSEYLQVCRPRNVSTYPASDLTFRELIESRCDLSLPRTPKVREGVFGSRSEISTNRLNFVVSMDGRISMTFPTTKRVRLRKKEIDLSLGTLTRGSFYIISSSVIELLLFSRSRSVFICAGRVPVRRLSTPSYGPRKNLSGISSGIISSNSLASLWK